MRRFERSIPSDYFERKYAADPDPWRFVASPYEQRKYAETLEALPRPRYENALEVGCSIGVFTRHLASRCTSLLATDVVESALEEATRRCSDLANVRFMRSRVPGDWPVGTFDLILMSEVVYYLDNGDVDALAAHAGRAIARGGDIVLVHWLGSTHYPLTGDEATRRFMAASAGFARVRYQRRTSEYQLVVLRALGDRTCVGI